MSLGWRQRLAARERAAKLRARGGVVGDDRRRSRREYLRERARLLKESRRCIRCRAGLLDEEIEATCTECQDARRAYGKLKRVRKVDLKRLRAAYPKDKEKRLADAKARRLAKKLRGECYDCPDPSLEDSLFCAPHRDKRRAASRTWATEHGIGKKKENPFVTDTHEAERLFWEHLRDQDPAALEIALDLLEEAELDITEVSMRRADPMWVAWAFAWPPETAGVFEIGRAEYGHTPGWWRREDYRAIRIADPGYIIVEWSVMRQQHPGWHPGVESISPVLRPYIPKGPYNYEVYFWRNGELWGELADSPPFEDLTEATDEAVMLAWRVVQAIKSMGHTASNEEIAESVFPRPSRFDGEPIHGEPIQ